MNFLHKNVNEFLISDIGDPNKLLTSLPFALENLNGATAKTRSFQQPSLL